MFMTTIHVPKLKYDAHDKKYELMNCSKSLKCHSIDTTCL